ncbi:MAG: hypothetical protein R3F53_02505 [Gammaproteobacteria bacterium]
MVCGFHDVGKGSAASLRRAGCRVMVSEVDLTARCRRRWKATKW